MSSDDAGGAPSPTALDGAGEWTTVVRSGRGAAPSAAAPSGSPASKAGGTGGGSGLVGSPSVNAAAGGSGSARGGVIKRVSPKRQESSPTRSDSAKLDEILKTFTTFGDSLNRFGQRLDGIEQREAERVADGSDGGPRAGGDGDGNDRRGRSRARFSSSLDDSGDDGDASEVDAPSDSERGSELSCSCMALLA